MKTLSTKLILFLLAALLICMSCEEKSGVVQPAPAFDILAFDSPILVSSNSENPFIITARITHPEGSAGIKSVFLKIISPGDSLLREVEMKDDGFLNPADSSGDVIAFDQVFSRLFLPKSFSNREGVYRFELLVTDVSDRELDMSEKLIEIVQNGKPVIDSFVFPDSIFAGLANGNASFIVSDPDGVDDVEWIEIQGTKAGATVVSLFDTLYNPNNGTNNFSAALDSSYGVGLSGEYQFEFFAEDRFGEKSAPAQQRMIFNNSAPLIWDAAVPDTVTIPTAGSLPIEITVRAKDGQSLGDIDQVYFDSYLPNGNPSSNNPFVMYDNGLPYDPNYSNTVGDTLAGDGVYTLTIFLGATATSGQFEFRFFATDKVGQSAQGPIKTLNVVE